MVRKRTSVSFDDKTIKIINEFVSCYADIDNFSTKAEEIIRDYSAIMIRTKKEVENIFTKDEFNYIYDILNGSIIDSRNFSVRSMLALEVEDADKYDKIGEKWGVDVKKLSKKVSRLPEAQAYGLVKIAQEYWKKK